MISDINECQSNPCLHGGSCNNLINAFSCNCTGRYEGDICETGKLDLRSKLSTTMSLYGIVERI